MAKAQAVAAMIDQIRVVSQRRDELADSIKTAVQGMENGVYYVDGDRVLVVKEVKDRSLKGFSDEAFGPGQSGNGGKKVAYLENVIKE